MFIISLAHGRIGDVPGWAAADALAAVTENFFPVWIDRLNIIRFLNTIKIEIKFINLNLGLYGSLIYKVGSPNF